jgi:chromosome segregation ATPase
MADKNKDSVELAAGLLIEVQQMNTKMSNVENRLSSMDTRLESIDNRLDKVHDQLVRNTAGVGELRLSALRLAEQLNRMGELEQRLKIVEDHIFRKGA